MRAFYRNSETLYLLVMQGKPRTWIISAHHWTRSYFIAELTERGLEVSGYQEIPQALVALRHKYTPRPHVIILDLQNIAPTKFEMDNLTYFKIPLIVITGHRDWKPAGFEVPSWVVVVKRPITVGAVCDQVQRLIHETPQPISALNPGCKSS